MFEINYISLRLDSTFFLEKKNYGMSFFLNQRQWRDIYSELWDSNWKRYRYIFGKVIAKERNHKVVSRLLYVFLEEEYVGLSSGLWMKTSILKQTRKLEGICITYGFQFLWRELLHHKDEQTIQKDM